MTIKNVLSLFDGMSCGQIALKKAGVKFNKYYASEINKFAIKISQKNFPETIQLGDVQKIKKEDIKDKIDLIIAGSPCQGFSYSGKKLNFEDPRSKLFFEFVRLLEELKPKYFLLENVFMDKECEQIITDILQVKPIKINSNLVSAQSRPRIYWTNIPNVSVPDDKKIFLKDILEKNPEKIVSMSESTTKRFLRYKIPFICGHSRKARCLSAVDYVKNGKQANYLIIDGSIDAWNLKNNYPDSGFAKENRFKIHSLEKKIENKKIDDSDINITIRKLTPIECERLQNVPENYTFGVSNSQRYHMLGNGWTIDIISYIFKNIK